MDSSPEFNRSSEILTSRKALNEYFSRVSIFSNSHPEITNKALGYDNPVPEEFPRGWELQHEGKNVSHLTLEDSSGNKIKYCLRPEGFDGFVYEPRTAYDRYVPVTHLNDQLLLGVISRSNEHYFLPRTPISSASIVRPYEDPIKDIIQDRLPIIDHCDINPNSAWVVSQGNRGLQYSGQAILPQDILVDGSGTHFKNPRFDKEAEITFLPPEKIIPNRNGPTVAATILALENRYGISDISKPLPFKPISFSEPGFLGSLDTTSLNTPTGGWRATEINNQTVDFVNFKLHSVNKRMGVSIGTSLTAEGKDIFRVNEINGGGVVVVPYFVENGTLFVGIIKETRPNVSPDKEYISVVRGFINPGDTPREAISHEIGQEMEFDGNPRDIAQHLQTLGIASQDPDMFGLGGVTYYALPIDKDILDEKDGKFVIKENLRAKNKDYNNSSEKVWEKITGSEFIPAELALQSPCLFATIATGRLLTSNLIPRPII